MGNATPLAWIYLRNPAEGRAVRDWLAFPNQQRACRDYCARWGVEVVQEFHEEESVEVPLRVRPCGVNLAASVDQASGFEPWRLTLVSLTGDRIWGNASEAVALLAWLAGRQVNLVLVEEEVAFSGAEDSPEALDPNWIAGGSYYAHALEQLVEGAERNAVEASREAATRNYLGPAPFGYRAVKGRLQPNPKELAVLGRIYTLSKVGRCSDAEIVRVLAREGAVARRGGPVGRKAVRLGLGRMEQSPALRAQALSAYERSRAKAVLA
ncbi:MAG: hypothetical protein JKY65_16635 [Planctomycetes bacterium]|nr:hypothetical protein [Planctomycetota bacterium]